jgi:hypothetical protein
VLPVDVRSDARIFCGRLESDYEPGTQRARDFMAGYIAGFSDDADGRLQRGVFETAFSYGCVDWQGDFEAAGL